jgi:hypothetical protein
MHASTGTSGTPSIRTLGGFAGDVFGQQPRDIDRILPGLIQDSYVVADARRGVASPDPGLPGSWARMDDGAIRAVGIDPALLHDAKSGFDATLYRDAGGAIVMVYAGTDQPKDWVHNVRQGLGSRDAQYAEAIELAYQVKRELGDRFILSGHSLGGGLAAAAAMAADVPAVTFNAAGVHDHTLERYGLDADAAKRQAEAGLVRGYHVRNEILTHLQEDSVPLKWAMPDAAGHAIELPDPDPLTFFERLVPGRMLRHRIELHFIESVMQAQAAARPQASACGAHDADTSNRLLRDALTGLSPQRGSLGLRDDMHFLDAVAATAAGARVDGLARIDHVVASTRGRGVFTVQGELDDPAHRRSLVDFDRATLAPARESAATLRDQDALQAGMPQPEARQQRTMPA